MLQPPFWTIHEVGVSDVDKEINWTSSVLHHFFEFNISEVQKFLGFISFYRIYSVGDFGIGRSDGDRMTRNLIIRSTKHRRRGLMTAQDVQSS